MRIKKSFFHKLALFLKGLAMGAANKVPGVSGGAVSYVLGFYEELIYSFKKVNFKACKLLLNGRFKSFYTYINGQFLVLIMSGSVFSYFSISLVLDYFLEHYELNVWSWFFGMIIGSIYYINKDFGTWTKTNLTFLLIGTIIGLAISFLTPAKENDNLWFVFVCGIIGVSGMTLPGLSGSFILILLGNYVLLLVDSVNVLFEVIISTFSGDFSVYADEIKMHYLKIISVFTLGSVVGLVTFSHLLAYVLKHFNKVVNALILGFITGSLGMVWPWKKTIYLTKNGEFLLDQKGNKIIENYERFFPEIFSTETLFAILSILFGFGLILFIDFYDKKRKL